MYSLYLKPFLPQVNILASWFEPLGLPSFRQLTFPVFKQSKTPEFLNLSNSPMNGKVELSSVGIRSSQI